MPLPEPDTREPLHERSIVCSGFERADGLWDIEAQLIDRKAYGFPNHDRGYIEAGEPLHDISLRLTLDATYQIHAVAAAIDSSPFHVCPKAVEGVQQLVGLRIEKGWMREVRKRIGGQKGCTHLIELLGPLATTAFQSLHKVRQAKATDEPGQTKDKPVLLNTCHALASDSTVVKRLWPQHYTGPDQTESE